MLDLGWRRHERRPDIERERGEPKQIGAREHETPETHEPRSGPGSASVCLVGLN